MNNLLNKFRIWNTKRRIGKKIEQNNKNGFGRKHISSNMNSDIHDFYILIIENYIKEEKVEEFKKKSGEGTYSWFIRFAGDMLLFRNNKVEDISTNFKFSTNYSEIYKDFEAENLHEIFPKEYFIYLILYTRKDNHPSKELNKKYIQLLDILSKNYNFNRDILDHLLEMRKLFSKRVFNRKGLKFSKLENLFHTFDASLEEILLFLYHYEIRGEISEKELDLNQIGRYLLSLSNQQITLNNYFFIFESCFDSTMESATKIPNFNIKFYNEGEYRFIIYYENKPMFVGEIIIVSKEEIFIRQIQGIKGANLNSNINWWIFMFRFIEIWAQNMNFSIISLYSSKCNYERLYKKGTPDEVKQRVEENYDSLGKSLNLNLADDGTWYKNI